MAKRPVKRRASPAKAHKRPAGELHAERMAVMRAMRAGSTIDQLFELTHAVFPPGHKNAGQPVVPAMFGLGHARVQALRREVLDDWQTEAMGGRKDARIEQLNRLRGSIQAARAAQKFSTLASLETVYARVAGTFSPIRIEVEEHSTFVAAIAEVAATMFAEPEQVDALLEEEEEAPAPPFARRALVRADSPGGGQPAQAAAQPAHRAQGAGLQAVPPPRSAAVPLKPPPPVPFQFPATLLSGRNAHGVAIKVR